MTHIKDEALDLALEALEALHKHGDIACVVTPEREFRLPQVITAIKQALAKDALYKLAEESCTSGLRLDDWDKIGCVNHDCDKCKAVQEPVAWLIPGSITTDFELAKANGDKAVPLGEISKQQWNPKDHYEDGWRDALESVKRATPPGGRQSEDCLTAAQRQWVGLTDEEINACDPQEECWGLHEAIRRAETKLKEKNT